jgi:transposase
VLDRAQTPSLMAPFQVIFVRNVRQLYTRGAKKDEFAALERYFRSPNPQALLILSLISCAFPPTCGAWRWTTRTALSG